MTISVDEQISILQMRVRDLERQEFTTALAIEAEQAAAKAVGDPDLAEQRVVNMDHELTEIRARLEFYGKRLKEVQKVQKAQKDA